MPGSVKIHNFKSTSIFVKNKGRQNDFNYWNDTDSNVSQLSCSYRIRLSQSLAALENNRVGYTIQMKFALSFRRLYPKEENKGLQEEKYERVCPANKENEVRLHHNEHEDGRKKLKMEDVVDTSQLSSSLLMDDVSQYSKAYSRGYEECFKKTEEDIQKVQKEVNERLKKYSEMFNQAYDQNVILREQIQQLQEKYEDLQEEFKKKTSGPLQEYNIVPAKNFMKAVEEHKKVCKGKLEEKQQVIQEQPKEELEDVKVEEICTKSSDKNPIEVKPPKDPPKEPHKDPLGDPDLQLVSSAVDMTINSLQTNELLNPKELYNNYRKKLKTTTFDQLEFDEKVLYKVLKHAKKANYEFNKVSKQKIIEELIESLHRSSLEEDLQ
jgi:hypothetical protein